ncbi:glycosyltransferase [Thauera sp. AutoDN2]|uniref:glycosyltransferase n=1 Tax=Thauera sp. AutoDN2 TaxID=3416051 RepID=UPI003F4C3DAD
MQSEHASGQSTRGVLRIDNTLKITIIMAGYGEGGLEKHVVELANGLMRHKKEGVQVCVIADPMYGVRFAQDITFMPFVFSGSRRNPIALFQLWRTIRQTRPNLVHAHGNKAASMIGSLLPLLKVHSVATLHSRKKNVRMFRAFERVIAVSKVSTLNLEHPGIRIVYNGIAPSDDHSQASDGAWHNAPRGKRVIAVGRLVPVKGFDILIEAWSKIDAYLLILGEGFERPRLESLIADRGLTDRVRLAGHQHDVLPYVRSADLMVISSRYEGCPYVLIEALQQNLPVASTRVGVMPELLPAQALYDVEDPSALASTIQYALTDLDAFKTTFEAAFTHASTQLTLDNMLERTLSIYKELF